MSQIIVVKQIHEVLDVRAMANKIQSLNYSVFVTQVHNTTVLVCLSASADQQDGFRLAEYLKNNSGLVKYDVVDEEA